MLKKLSSYWFILMIIAAIATAAHAGPDPFFASYDPCSGAQLDCAPGAKNITKVKPPLAPPSVAPPAPCAPTSPFKIKTPIASQMGSKWDALTQNGPSNWWADCCLPTPAKGQFWVGPRVTFARLHGEARRGFDIAAFQSSRVDFDDQLNFRKTGNTFWSIEAMYQLRPRWGIRYSFSPIHIESVGFPKTAFNFSGQTFAAGTQVASKWERYQHRAGLLFNISRTTSSQANLYADWLNIQDRLSVAAAGTTNITGTWDDTKNIMVLGLEFDKCLKNFHGNTLALSGKGGIGFLNDTVGYEAEAALSYLIPIKTGRFGFVKGGYSYANYKKEKNSELFSTVIDGPFVQAGFLF